MSSNDSDVVEELLTNRIDSFEKLEIVVALHAAPHTTMSLSDLCRELKLSPPTVRQAVTELHDASLVDLAATGEVKLLPPSSRDRAAVAELVELYENDRLAIVKKLSEVALGRIRNMASRAFADAFVIRKRPPKGEEDG